METVMNANTGVSVKDGIARLALDFNEVNALNGAALGRLEAAFRELGRDESIRLVILESARPGWFSNGLELQELHAHPENMADFQARFFGALEALYRLPAPVVAVLDGHCMGYGTMLALLSDYRLMTAGKYRISLPEANLGIRVPALIARVLQELVPGPLARDMMLLGNALKPAEAREVGLVDELLPADQVEAKVERFARKFANLSITGTRASKKAARHAVMSRLDEILELDMREASLNMATPDAREGIRAFVEKRRPRFA